jgi:hypothetical protein
MAGNVFHGIDAVNGKVVKRVDNPSGLICASSSSGYVTKKRRGRKSLGYGPLTCCFSYRCRVYPAFGPAGEESSSATHCAKHKLKGYENLRCKLCAASHCRLRASFGPAGGKPSSATHCAKHQLDGYERLTGKLCAASDCRKHASFGPAGGKSQSATHCLKHKPEGYENVKMKRCVVAECRKGPSYGPAGGNPSSATHCSRHKLDGYVDVLRKRCETCTLLPANFRHSRSKTMQCFECDPIIWRRQKLKEEAFADALKRYGFTEGDFGRDLSFCRELPVSFSNCKLGVDRMVCGEAVSQRARVDFVLQGRSCVVLVEVDEDQHTDRCVQSEVARASEIVHALWLGGNKRYVLLIRFNPDKFEVDGKTSCVPLSERYMRVVRVIRAALIAPDLPKETFAMQYMYYDVRGGRECILDEIDPCIAALCLPPIV